MQSIFSNVTKADIMYEPFPHIVIRNALPTALADQLLAEYPRTEYLGQGRQGLVKDGVMPNNLKLRYHSVDVLNDTDLSPLWREFIMKHISGDFFLEFIRIFKDDLIALHPHIADFLNSIQASDVGVQHIDSFPQKKALLNAEICADTPVKKESSVRGIHLDHPNKLAVALLYLKGKEDDSIGGEFEMYRQVNDAPFVINHIRNIKHKYVKNFEKVKSVPYEHNTLLLFLNSPKSFHGVSPRKKTKHSRLLFDVAFDVGFPLFDVTKHEEQKWLTHVRAQFMRLTGMHKEKVTWI